MGNVLGRNDVLKADDLSRELVAVPEWGGEVWVRSMNGAERDKFEASIVQQRGNNRELNMANIRAKLAAMSICDENGKRLFGDEDIQALGQKSAAALQRVFTAAQRLSGIGEDATAELAGGLKENPLDGSVSG
jgi:hypothetical protein